MHRVIYENAQWNCPPVWRIQDFSDDEVRWNGSIQSTFIILQMEAPTELHNLLATQFQEQEKKRHELRCRHCIERVSMDYKTKSTARKQFILIIMIYQHCKTRQPRPVDPTVCHQGHVATHPFLSSFFTSEIDRQAARTWNREAL